MTKILTAVALTAMVLATAGCGVLRRESPQEARKEAAMAELKRLCGTTNLAIAPRRLELGVAPVPHDCRALLTRAGAL